MKRRNIKKINIPPKAKEDKKQYPRLTIRQNQKPKLINPRQAVRTRNISRKPLTEEIAPPIKFLEHVNFNSNDSEICFVVGGGPSLNGFDFTQLNGFDTIAVNKSVEYIPNPTYFITTDYSYFVKASLPIERIKQKSKNTYFVANMTHDYMSFQNGRIVDTRRNFIYNDLYQYTGVIESNNVDGFGSSLAEFSKDIRKFTY